MSLPSDDAIRALHRKYAPSSSAFDLVYGHCAVVAHLASFLVDANQLAVDRSVVRAGALLHDIGAYLFFDQAGVLCANNYVAHGPRGAEILLQEDMEERLCRIAERHTGAGITAQEVVAHQYPMEARDYLAESLEERVIMYADKFHSKVGLPPGRFVSHGEYLLQVDQFGAGPIARYTALAEEFGVPNISDLEVGMQD